MLCQKFKHDCYLSAASSQGCHGSSCFMNLRAIVDPTTREDHSDLGHFELSVGKFSVGSEKSGDQYQGPGPQAAGIGTELHSAQHLDNVTVMHVKVHHDKVHHDKVHLGKMAVSHVKVLGPSLKRS